MDLTVIIPTYNEAMNVPILIERIYRVFREYSLEGELIIVDDDSPDRTWEVAQQLKSVYNNLEVLRRFEKRGLSSAVLDGMQLARGNIIGVMDADLSHPPEKIPELVKPIISGDSDLVIGSRYVEGGDIQNWPLRRMFSSKLATLSARGLTNIKDPMSGFFFFRKEVIEGVELSPKGFKIGLEILIKGRYKNPIEVPILFIDRKYEASKLSSGVILEYFSQILELYVYRFFRAELITKLLSFSKSHIYIIVALLLFLVTFTVYYFTGEGGATPYHYFVPLADAFLHGRLYLLEKPTWLNELIPLNGRFYVIYPPMPAILLLPQVAISGVEASQTLASVFWGSINVTLIYFLMKKLTDNRRLQIWMALLFGFGTIHWYLASIGKAWFFAQVTSFLFLTLAIYETLTRKRPLLIGLLLGASYWSRIPAILSLPFFIIMLSDEWLSKSNVSSFFRRINLVPLIKLGSGVGIFIILNFIYNYLRFDTPLDIAYSIQTKEEPWWYPKGFFNISYIPTHLWIFFLKPPIFTSNPPYVMPSLMGMSILLTTPAFVYSVFAGIRNKLAIACWSAIVPIALLHFTHGGTGWMQFGYRYAVDYYPFLLVLTAVGMKSTLGNDSDLTWDQKLLICFGILVNLWGVIWINKFGWGDLWG